MNIVSPDFKRHPATTTSIQDIPSEAPSGGEPSRRRRYIDEVEQEGVYLFNLAKQYVLHPAVAGGLIGLGTYFSCYVRVPKVLISRLCSEHRVDLGSRIQVLQ